MKRNIIEVIINLIINYILVFIFNKFLDINYIFICFGIFFSINFITYLFNKKDKIKYLSFCTIYLFLLIILGFYLNFSMYLIILIMHIVMLILSKINSVKTYEYLFLGCSFAVLSLIITSNSNSSPNGNNMTYTDSSVTKYIGKIMTQGRIPYIDGFDHKGLFLFIINFIGYIIHEQWGIWLLENIALIITMIFGYKFIKLHTNNKIASFFSIIACMLSIAYVYNGGSYSDEWDIPLITITLYYFTKGLKDGIFKKYYSFVIGVCCSLAFLLRPNIILIWAFLALYLLYWYIRNKDTKELKKTILYFSFGNLIILVPSIIYLLINGAFGEFIYQCFIFNLNYAKNWPSSYGYIEIIKYFDSVLPIIIPCFGISIALIFNKKDRKYNVLNLILYIITLYIIMSPLNPYEHYAMILIPLLFLPIGKIFASFIDSYDIKVKGIVLIFIILAFYNKEINFMYNKAIQVNNDTEWLVEIKNAIMENSEEKDNVLVMGNECLLYLISNRTYHHKFFNSGVTIIDEKLKQEFIDEVEMDNPKLIITNNAVKIDEITEIIKSNYDYIGTFNPSYEVYKLKIN